MYIALAPVPSEVNIYTATDFNKYWLWSSTILKAFHMELDISHRRLLKVYNFSSLFELWIFSVLGLM